MVACGSYKDRPGRDPLSGFMILLYVCLGITLILAAGSMFEFITHLGKIVLVATIISFITNAVNLAAAILLLIGYFKNKQNCIKLAFFGFIALGILDITILLFFIIRSLAIVISLTGIIRIFPSLYLILVSYTHAYTS